MYIYVHGNTIYIYIYVHGNTVYIYLQDIYYRNSIFTEIENYLQDLRIFTFGYKIY